MRARGASYERGGGVVLRATMQVNTEQSLMHGGSRIANAGAVIDRDLCLLSLWRSRLDLVLRPRAVAFENQDG